MITKHKFTILILLSFFIFNLNAQIDKEYQIKSKPWTGVRLGYNWTNNFGEVGIGHILIDKPCNQDQHHAFHSICSFPKRLEVDGTFDFALDQRKIYSQKLTLLYTIFARQTNVDRQHFIHKVIYFTFGHIIAGANAINYTDFESNKVVFGTELAWMAPERIGLRRKMKKDKLQLDMRVSYLYNWRVTEAQIYGLRKHQFAVHCLFLISGKNR